MARLRRTAAADVPGRTGFAARKEERLRKQCAGLTHFYARRRNVKTPEFVYAGFWVRAGARHIDAVILGGAKLVLFLVADAIGAAVLPVFVDVLLKFGGVYEPVMTARFGQGTIGEQVMGLAMTGTQGRRLSPSRSYGQSSPRSSRRFLGISAFYSRHFAQTSECTTISSREQS